MRRRGLVEIKNDDEPLLPPIHFQRMREADEIAKLYKSFQELGVRRRLQPRVIRTALRRSARRATKRQRQQVRRVNQVSVLVNGIDLSPFFREIRLEDVLPEGRTVHFDGVWEP